MKILFTIGSIAGGGAERVVARLANEMSLKGHEVFVALIAQNKIEYEVGRNVVTHFVDAPINIRGLRFLSRMQNYRAYVKRISPDVVISFTVGVNNFVLQALRGSGIKVIVSERNNPYVDPPREKDRKKRDKLYKKADAFVFQTEDAREYFSDDIQKRSIVILNPIDVEALPSPNKAEREKRIVTVGRLEPQKNQKLLINAFSKIANEFPEYQLQIYGTGALESELNRQIKDLGLEDRVHLMGHDKQVLEHICNASMFVLSSDYEGISNALLEAMAIGLPVISTDHPIGGARLLIDNKSNGILVPVRDEEKLSQAMRECIKNYSLSEKMAEKALRIVDEASVEAISQRWIDFISNQLQK